MLLRLRIGYSGYSGGFNTSNASLLEPKRVNGVLSESRSARYQIEPER